MKLENLNADEFQNAMCLLADVAEDVMNGELGAKAKAAYAKFRSDSAKAKAKATAKAKGDPEAAKAAATAEVNGLAVDMVAGLLPDVLRQGGEISYKLLAALDGQTLEEYKADFTVKKWVADIKDAIDGIDGIKDVLAPFFWIAAEDPSHIWLCLGEYVGPRRARPFSRYMVARWRERDEREAFRVYLSESVRLMAQGKWLKEPFLSIVNGGAGDGSEADDTRSGDEIAADIIERMGLKVV